MKITITREGRAWAWEVRDESGKVIFGGYSRTKSDGLHDINRLIEDARKTADADESLRARLAKMELPK